MSNAALKHDFEQPKHFVDDNELWMKLLIEILYDVILLIAWMFNQTKEKAVEFEISITFSYYLIKKIVTE